MKQACTKVVDELREQTWQVCV